MQLTTPAAEERTLGKAAMLRSIPLQRASLDRIASQYLYLSDLGLPLDNADRAAHAYYGATGAEVQKAFQHWMRPDDLASIVKGPTPTW